MLMIPGGRPQTSAWVIVRSSNFMVSTVGAALPSGHCIPSFFGVVHCQTPPANVASPPVRPVEGDMCSRQVQRLSQTPDHGHTRRPDFVCPFFALLRRVVLNALEALDTVGRARQS